MPTGPLFQPRMPDDPGPDTQPSKETIAMNTNLFHNILNVVFLVVGVLVTFDWTVFGFDATVTVKIVGALMLAQNLLKLGINVTRDGVAGLVKPQPPVDGN